VGRERGVAAAAALLLDGFQPLPDAGEIPVPGEILRALRARTVVTKGGQGWLTFPCKSRSYSEQSMVGSAARPPP